MVPRLLQSAGLYKVSPPDFFILGTQKAGTSSLYRMLIQHPEVTGPIISKELQFFNKIETLSLDRIREYERLFFPDWFKQRKRSFEATPEYLFHEQVPQMLKEYAPNSKFIILLRDPVERAFSHWRMIHFKWARLQRKNTEVRSFMEVCSDTKHEVVQRGIYINQLQRYFKLFNAGQFLILDSNCLLRETQVTMNAITEFLGVEEHQFTPWFGHKGEGLSTPDMETVDFLNEFYTPYNEKLKSFLGELGVKMSWL